MFILLIVIVFFSIFFWFWHFYHFLSSSISPETHYAHCFSKLVFLFFDILEYTISQFNHLIWVHIVYIFVAENNSGQNEIILFNVDEGFPSQNAIKRVNKNCVFYVMAAGSSFLIYRIYENILNISFCPSPPPPLPQRKDENQVANSKQFLYQETRLAHEKHVSFIPIISWRKYT